MDLEYCLVINYWGQTGLVHTYYLVELEALEIFEQWYSNLDFVLLDSGTEINKQNLKYKIIDQTNDHFTLVKDFIQTFGSPWELLEQIDGLEQMFVSEENPDSEQNPDSDTDSELYTQTETIGQIISAHIDGNVQKVKELLESSNGSKLDDEVIFNIKKKYI